MLNGHMHNYKPFTEQTPTGWPPGGRSIREFVVGTGGGKFHHCRDCTITGTTKESTLG